MILLHDNTERIQERSTNTLKRLWFAITSVRGWSDAASVVARVESFIILSLPIRCIGTCTFVIVDKDRKISDQKKKMEKSYFLTAVRLRRECTHASAQWVKVETLYIRAFICQNFIQLLHNKNPRLIFPPLHIRLWRFVAFFFVWYYFMFSN